MLLHGIPLHAGQAAFFFLFLFRRPKKSYSTRRIRRVLISIHPAEQANKIRYYVICAVRIVLPIPVVVQSRLFIEVLPLEPDRIPNPRLVRRLADLVLQVPDRFEQADLRHRQGKATRKSRGTIDLLEMPSHIVTHHAFKLDSVELRSNVISKLRSPCLAS